jgi:hypothetical protein
MRRSPPLLVALAVLGALVPAVASAKGLARVTFCGPAGCVERSAQVRHRPAVREALLGVGDSVADPGPAPFVLVRERLGDGDQVFPRAIKLVFFPKLGILKMSDATFVRPHDPAVRRALRGLVRGLSRFPARSSASG